VELVAALLRVHDWRTARVTELRASIAACAVDVAGPDDGALRSWRKQVQARARTRDPLLVPSLASEVDRVIASCATRRRPQCQPVKSSLVTHPPSPPAPQPARCRRATRVSR
jgi:hypothetical protein